MSDPMKLKLCAVIKFCIKQKKNRVETMKLNYSTYREVSMSQKTIYEWYNRFENSIEDDPRNSQPKEATEEKKWKLCGIFWRNYDEYD